MKKLSAIFLAVFFALAAFSTGAVYAAPGGMSCSENALDKSWDWWTTRGKSGVDRESVLAQNKAERAQKCAEKLAKQAQKEAGKAVDKMQKKLGL